MVSLDNSQNNTQAGAVWLLPVVFTVTIFVSASLLFFVQPLFAKLALPQIGGAPAVWTTAMLFFQVVLLCGYIYAHLLTKFVPLRWQLPIHLAFWAVSLLFLPLAISEGWQYDPAASTALQTLTLFALGVGVPFGMLSANAPLLQSWYAGSAGPSAQDPYFLYGSSNLGSLLALLAFPLVAEPLLGAQAIGVGWSVVFGIFGLCLAASGLLALRFPALHKPQISCDTPRTRLTVRQGATWIFVAFVPSSLMLAVTTKISTDMGALPLIWVVPLAIYICTFVITFTNRPLLSDRVLPALALAACAVMTVQMTSLASELPTWGNALLFAPMLFVVATFAHRKLYLLRPEAGQLTVFYICMSVGGAMGGLFNSILAPTLFDSLHEGWISVLCATIVGIIGAARIGPRPLALGVLIAGGAVAVFRWLGTNEAGTMDAVLFLGAIAVFALAVGTLWRAPVAALVCLGAFTLTDLAASHQDTLFQDRSFFGTHQIFDTEDMRVYTNGTTVHGYQALQSDGARPVPRSYYYPQSPMAQVLTQSAGVESARIALVGLGVGSLACYATQDQSWAFYEIDKMVDDAARNPAFFTYMSECAPGSRTHLGDARIVLAQQDSTFDIMVLDAYSSDSIPAHLVTVEAVQSYLDRLAPDGQLVFHISNRYYDLSQPLARISATLGLHAVIQYDSPTAEAVPGAAHSVVMVLSPSAERIETLKRDSRWTGLESDGQPAWTDDHTNLLSALK